MAFISYADRGADSKSVAAQFKEVLGKRATSAPNFLRIHASRPEVIRSHHQLQQIVLQEPSALTPLQRMMIGLVVSQINDCLYWLQRLGKLFQEQFQDEDLVARLQSDYRAADLPVASRVMLEYCAKLTRAPRTVGQADVDALHAAGFSDAAIHDICLVTAYFAFANRLAQGLGVELEPGGGPK